MEDFLNQLAALRSEIGIAELIDVAIMTVLVYSVLVWLKNMRRSASVITGILIVSAVYLMARQFNLTLTAGVLQGFFAVFIIAMVVIFQEEIRYFFEHISEWSFNPRFSLSNRRKPTSVPEHIETLVRTLREIAREKIGALIVIRGKDLIVRHVQGGVGLQGEISEEILRSIFDPHSSGHDGAVIIEGNRIEKFGCYLPLSKNFARLRQRGTRHAAALGLSELSDALALVVSEEKGTISAARHGEIQRVTDPQKLMDMIVDFYREMNPDPDSRSVQSLIRRNWKEKVLAFVLSLVFWFVLVHGSYRVSRTFEVPVEYSSLQSNLSVEEIKPETINITFSGPRKEFFLMNPGAIKLVLSLRDVRKGERSVAITGDELTFPETLVLEKIYPQRVRVRIE